MDFPEVDLESLISFLNLQKDTKRSYDGYSITIKSNKIFLSELNKIILGVYCHNIPFKNAYIEIIVNFNIPRIYSVVSNYPYLDNHTPEMIFEKLFPKGKCIVPEEDLKEPN